MSDCMNAAITVSISKELLQTIFESARRLHPKETILLLRGEKKKNVLKISELIVPPLATYGQGFANIPLHMLPMDFSIVGTLHSHPSGSLTPSTTDLNHFIGIILMIVAFPFADERNIAIYNRSGEKLMLRITKD
ncbi:MAG: Mov34/MPN/PAD-1 family protein [Candidatus Bathyarchaeota archaeon]|nr:Mov34/MPN/PAD-1 family protein [Candidatus Bathyarchaeota archaeon]MDH5754802.1 Mov34/MPN/PAD-1 family protein [Candidatus Bathyarchaeota archaeon]